MTQPPASYAWLFFSLLQHMPVSLVILTKLQSPTPVSPLPPSFRMRCGAQYTSKLEGMLNDLATAEAANGDFKTWLTTKKTSEWWLLLSLLHCYYVQGVYASIYRFPLT